MKKNPRKFEFSPGSFAKRHQEAGCPDGIRCTGPRCRLQTGKTAKIHAKFDAQISREKGVTRDL